MTTEAVELNNPIGMGEDDIRQLLREIRTVPMLTPPQEQALAKRCTEGDEEAVKEMVKANLRLVVSVAKEYAGRGVPLLDLIQEGSLGLWQAIRNYRSGAYAPHRDRWIRFYMAKAVTLQARANGVGQKMRTALEDYKEVDERLLGELGRNPTLEEIALELHMSVDETSSVKKMLEDARLLAQAKKPAEPEEEKEEEEQAVEDTALFQMRQRILDLLSGVSEEDQKLLTLRFGLEGGKPMSPEDAGKRLGLTPDEVVAREAAALAKLRNA